MYEKLRVLVVDDFATMRKIIVNILKQMRFKEIYQADDGTTALEVLKKEKIDLILSDWNMPKMNGLELLKQVRSNPEWNEVKFVMVTAESQKQNVME